MKSTIHTDESGKFYLLCGYATSQLFDTFEEAESAAVADEQTELELADGGRPNLTPVRWDY